MTDSVIFELERFECPPCLSAERFGNFIYYLSSILESTIPIKHQALCRCVRLSCGLSADERKENYPAIFPFDQSPKGVSRFVESLSKKVFTKYKRRLGFELLSNCVAETLGFRNWDMCLFSLEIYKNLSSGNWYYQKKEIKKPKGSDNENQYLEMPGWEPLRYGGMRSFIPYRVFQLKGCEFFYAAPVTSPIIYPSGRRQWGYSIADAKNWSMSQRIAEIGITSWNLYVAAQRIEEGPKLMKLIDKASCAEWKWTESHKQ